MKPQSQRQLRAGELVRRAVSDILAEGHIHDPGLAGLSVTVTEARVSPDLRHATVFIAVLGQADVRQAAGALNRAAGYIQKQLGREIDMKFTPKLNFVADESFEAAQHVDEVLARPGVQRDLDHGDEDE
ncbi:30S ribosome-binding factor RbfA [Marinicauda salina]|jgi:ribosome-binding factor A|uniref:Ribosome-binding factor A n=1 Tax=Marinicauda salina TaxID=2135793 RepID=A0A2U2BWC0_9PROT|nr:30S ribosome-binding factor RbfA [Marinicauda salina]PWE18316.1 30S ribosome-binding factor RbfA [Marinicauda salina]